MYSKTEDQHIHLQTIATLCCDWCACMCISAVLHASGCHSMCMYVPWWLCLLRPDREEIRDMNLQGLIFLHMNAPYHTAPYVLQTKLVFGRIASVFSAMIFH